MFGGASGGAPMLDTFNMGLKITYGGVLRLGIYCYLYLNFLKETLPVYQLHSFNWSIHKCIGRFGLVQMI